MKQFSNMLKMLMLNRKNDPLASPVALLCRLHLGNGVLIVRTDLKASKFNMKYCSFDKSLYCTFWLFYYLVSYLKLHLSHKLILTPYPTLM